MKILAVGDSCIDKFYYGDCVRICPEGPVPVLDFCYATERAGMVDNVTNNVRALGVDCDTITNAKKETKTRYIDQNSNQLIMRFDNRSGDNHKLDIDTLPDLGSYDVIIVSDYDKGFIAEEVAQHISIAHSRTLLDTKRKLGEWADGFTFIKLNREEYMANKTYVDNNKDRCIITLGAEGCMYKEEILPPPQTHASIDVAGAGDTFIAAFAVELCTKQHTAAIVTQAITFAQYCCSKVIMRKGTATV